MYSYKNYLNYLEKKSVKVKKSFHFSFDERFTETRIIHTDLSLSLNLAYIPRLSFQLMHDNSFKYFTLFIMNKGLETFISFGLDKQMLQCLATKLICFRHVYLILSPHPLYPISTFFCQKINENGQNKKCISKSDMKNNKTDCQQHGG